MLVPDPAETAALIIAMSLDNTKFVQRLQSSDGEELQTVLEEYVTWLKKVIEEQYEPQD